LAAGATISEKHTVFSIFSPEDGDSMFLQNGESSQHQNPEHHHPYHHKHFKSLSSFVID
jgi:hypothetical protein